MSRRTTPSSDEFRDDLDFDQLTWENELAREQARQQRRRQSGRQRDLSERLEGHTTPLAVGVGRSPLVTPTAVRDALQRAMDLSGIPLSFFLSCLYILFVCNKMERIKMMVNLDRIHSLNDFDTLKQHCLVFQKMIVL